MMNVRRTVYAIMGWTWADPHYLEAFPEQSGWLGAMCRPGPWSGRGAEHLQQAAIALPVLSQRRIKQRKDQPLEGSHGCLRAGSTPA